MEPVGYMGGCFSRNHTGGGGGLNTFKRRDVDNIVDPILSSTTAAPLASVPRRAMRRRNFKYLLPHEGYYDRTGFNGPVSYDPSTVEYSCGSSLGELTLGYVASAGKFHPVDDPIDPTGVWNICEKLESSRSFSGVDTSATFPYRGLSSLGSNDKMPEIGAATARYVDRGQVPVIYNTMHELLESQARDYAFQQISKFDNSLSHEDTDSWMSEYLLMPLFSCILEE